jgi:hypothetical protein
MAASTFTIRLLKTKKIFEILAASIFRVYNGKLANIH